MNSVNPRDAQEEREAAGVGHEAHKLRAQALGDQPAQPMPGVSQDQSTGSTTVWQTYGGLTKREEFAKAAMQGLLADPDMNCLDGAAKNAVEAADALLLELSK